jgi:sugar/nucleoside kinase (ribokinase family)
VSGTNFDVVGVGNAIVDVLASVSDAFLDQYGIAKGAMTLIDADRAAELTKAFPPGELVAGGSAANTLAGVASFGARGAYMGKVADDMLGDAFETETRAIGVSYATARHTGGEGTARCLIAVSPDAQRSMSTFLGCSSMFSPADLDPDVIRAAAITFMEGYLFDREDAKRAFVQAAEIARAAGRKTAITLSDTFCVDRHRDSFLHLITHHMDIVFANEAELLALFQETDFERALGQLRGRAEVAAVTRSEKGSILLRGDDTVVVTAAPAPTVIDTTGAGDLYAAGVLTGLARGQDLGDCGRLGSIAAAEVISHVGPRPRTSLKALAAAAGL